MTKKKTNRENEKKSAIGKRKICKYYEELRDEALEEEREIILDYDSEDGRIRLEAGCYNVEGEGEGNQKNTARYGVKIFVGGEEYEAHYRKAVYDDVLKYREELSPLERVGAGIDEVHAELERLLTGGRIARERGLSEKVEGDNDLKLEY